MFSYSVCVLPVFFPSLSRQERVSDPTLLYDFPSSSSILTLLKICNRSTDTRSIYIHTDVVPVPSLIHAVAMNRQFANYIKILTSERRDREHDKGHAVKEDEIRKSA